MLFLLRLLPSNNGHKDRRNSVKFMFQTCIPTVPGWNLDQIIGCAEIFRCFFLVSPHKFKGVQLQHVSISFASPNNSVQTQKTKADQIISRATICGQNYRYVISVFWTAVLIGIPTLSWGYIRDAGVKCIHNSCRNRWGKTRWQTYSSCTSGNNLKRIIK